MPTYCLTSPAFDLLATTNQKQAKEDETWPHLGGLQTVFNNAVECSRTEDGCGVGTAVG